MSPQGNISNRLGASGNPEDDEDFIPLTQGTDTYLGYEATIQVKQKRPGKRDREPAEAESNRSTRKDLHQNYTYKDCDITARRQEPQSMPQSRPDSYHEVNSERGQGKRDQAETATQPGFYYDRGREQFPHADKDCYITAGGPEPQSMSQSKPDKLTNLPDSTSSISKLSTELSLASHRGRVGSDVNSHLSIIAAAALREYPEIGPILRKHIFRQGEFAWQLYTELSSRDMEAIVQDLVLTNSLNVWFAEEASVDWPQFLRGLRAHLLKAYNSIHIEPRIIRHLGELTTVVLDIHPEIRSVLEIYGTLQGSSADHLYSEMSSESMLALANDLLPTIHAGSMLCPKVSSEVKVENTKDITWKQHREDKCFISGCNDMADKVVYDKVMIRHICNCGCKERPEYDR